MASILRLQLRLRLWIRIPNPSQVTGRAVIHYGNARWPQFWTGREWADPGQSQSSKVKWNKRWQQQKLCQVFPAKHESSAITRAPRQTEKQKAKGKKTKGESQKSEKVKPKKESPGPRALNLRNSRHSLSFEIILRHYNPPDGWDSQPNMLAALNTPEKEKKPLCVVDDKINI